MNYVWSTGTHVGRVRKGNEDAVYPTESGASEGPTLLMVADGMGGAVAGEVASRLAVEAASTPGAGEEITPEDRVLAANRAVIEATERDPALAGMGTTMTLVLLRPDGVADFAISLPGYTASSFPLTLVAEMPGVIDTTATRAFRLGEGAKHLTLGFDATTRRSSSS